MKFAVRPGTGLAWRWARRLAQLLLPVGVLAAPLLGGWQRLDRNRLAAWEGHGWDLPARVLDRLPAGNAPRQAYEAIVLAGGGTAADYGSIPVVDPLAGVMALTAGADLGLRSLLALALVLVVGTVTGRAFCGWLCPFGTIARGVELMVERLPWRPRRYALPARRPVRFVLLGACLLLGMAGSHALMVLTLPHALVQQASYGAWLMGGAGAALGALGGLVLAGVLFGPTTYCATVCPTGAALSLVGRKRPVRLTIIEPARCGTRCDLCDHACWLSLRPSTGDPGPDCDACGRCTEVCPHTNLAVGAMGKIRRRVVGASLLAALAFFSPTRAAGAEPPSDPHKPALLLEATRSVEGVDLAVTVVDLGGVELDADSGVALRGVELSAYVARGPAGDLDELGRAGPRDTYDGPLRLVITPKSAVEHRVEFEHPTDPISTPNRTIYRRRIPVSLEPGSIVTLEPVPGWTEDAVSWEVPGRGSAGALRTVGFGVGGLLLFSGLLSLALAVRA
jgi:ferredoxin-type protein NapH